MKFKLKQLILIQWIRTSVGIHKLKLMAVFENMGLNLVVFFKQHMLTHCFLFVGLSAEREALVNGLKLCRYLFSNYVI